MSKAVTPINKPNNTNNFFPADDQWVSKEFPFKASTAIAEGTAVAIEVVSNTTTGNLTVSGAENANGADIVGILAEPISATDPDYAVAGKLKSVWVPRTPSAEAYFTVGAGTFTSVDVGKTVELHTGSATLAVDTAGKGARITEYISATKGKCVFCMPATETA